MKKYLFLLSFLVTINLEAQSWDWVQNIGGSGNDYVWDIITDSEGNVIVCGRVKFDTEFGIGPFSESSTALGIQTDIYVAKFSPEGDLLWKKRSGNVNPDWGRGLAVDQYDNVYMTGDFTNIAVFESDTIYGYDNGSTNPNTMARSGFLVKYDKEGNLQWVDKFQGTGHTRGYSVTVANDLTIYVTGYMTGITQFDDQTTGVDGEDLGFIAKYTNDGTCIWAKTLVSPYASRGNHIKVVNDTLIAVTGSYNGSLVYEGVTIPGITPSWGDYFLMGIDTAGGYYWSSTGKGSFFNEGREIAVDEEENLYVIGRFSYICNFDGDTLISMGVGSSTVEYVNHGDAFVARYNSETGEKDWLKQLGNEYSVDFTGITVLDQQVIVSGFSIDSIFIESDTLIPVLGNHNSMIVSFDKSSGDYLWNKMVGGSAPVVGMDDALSGNVGHGVSTDNLGNIYVGGYYNSTAEWDATSHYSVGGYDAYIAKLFPPITIDLSFDMACSGDSSLFMASSNGWPLNYSWSSDIGIVGSSDSNWVNVFYPGTGEDSIWCTVTNGYESDSAYILVNVLDGPIFYFSNDTSTCEESLLLVAEGANGSNFDWGTGAILNDSTNLVFTSGNYVLQTENSSGCVYTDSIQVLVDYCANTEGFNEEILIFPNPFQTHFMVKNNSGNVYYFEIRSIAGELIFSNTLSPNEQQEIDLSEISSGIYFFTTNQNSENSRMLIKY